MGIVWRLQALIMGFYVNPQMSMIPILTIAIRKDKHEQRH